MSNARVDQLPSLMLRKRVREFEIELILEALDRVNGNRVDAAAVLGIPLRTLVYKMTKYGVRERMRARGTAREVTGEHEMPVWPDRVLEADGARVAPETGESHERMELSMAHSAPRSAAR